MLQDEEVAEIIANHVITEDITNLHPEEMDKLAMFQYADDPDVSFDPADTEEQTDTEAGPEGHGQNTEEEMNYTWSDEKDA